MHSIIIRHAAENNLRDVDVDIHHGCLTVVTGVSGSGKSSLVFDVTFREAQRRYLETFSVHARQFMGKLRRPEVGLISGLAPAVAVSQRRSSAGARSTVGTLTEIHDDLRLLFARLGSSPAGLRLSRRMFSFNAPEGACPACRGLGVEDRIDPDLLIADPEKTLRQGALALTTPNGYIIYSQVTIDILDQVCRAHGFSTEIPWKDLTEAQREVVLNGSDRILIPFGKHPLESRLRWKGITAKPREEGYYRGILPIMEMILRTKRNDNILRFARTLPCRGCGGRRLRPESLRVSFRDHTIADLSELTVRGLADHLRGLDFAESERAVGEIVQASLLKKTELLGRLGLGYLRIDRDASSLSGGESQRIRLASQAGGGLRGVLYVLDEPTAGLHSADTACLLDVLADLRDKGNTILVVEHDEDFMRAADRIIDLGPGPGVNGGRVLYQGPAADFVVLPRGTSPTRDFLAGDRCPANGSRKRPRTGRILIRGAGKHNLRGFDAEFHLGALNVVTGVSGAGKSTLVRHILAERLRTGRFGPGPDAAGLTVDGPLGKIVEIDQAPIGRSPRSNPATYTKISDRIRDLFAALPEARALGFGKSRFSFNVPGGRCETCLGAGLLQIGMHFLGDVDVGCPDCEGRRFNDPTLGVRDRGKNIHDVLELSVEEAAEFYSDHSRLHEDLEILKRLGLGYLKLGQSSSSLSGGEAQRVKLAAELGKSSSGPALYVLEEPTTGLHRADVENLLTALHALVDRGRTIVAIEHHLDVIRAADHVVDLGPGSGEDGGWLVAAGTPEEVAACPASLTGRALRGEFAAAACRKRATAGEDAAGPIVLEGVSTHNLRDLDVRIPFQKFTVVGGPSGGGKSSLVFDTLFAAARQKYIESFSAYVRSMIDKGGRADYAAARGLTPPIAVRRSASAYHPRSTVGTMTELLDYFRLLYSRAGQPPVELAGRPLTASMFSFNHEQGACEICKGLGARTVADPDRFVTDPKKSLLAGALDGTKTGRFYGDPHGQHLAALRAAGGEAGFDFSRPAGDLSENARQMALSGTGDRLYDIVWPYRRGKRSGDFRFQGPWKGFVCLITEEYERKHADHRGEAMRVLMKNEPCAACGGRRLKPGPLGVTYRGRSIAHLLALSVKEAISFFDNDPTAEVRLDAKARAVTAALRGEILRRLRLIRNIGLDYLSLDRPSDTLSGGEAQRLRLSGLLGVRLTGVTFVLDEPTLGLHPRDTEKLLGLIRALTAEGNTVVAVEHDLDVVRAADHVIDLGPGAGRDGGRITAEGPPSEIAKQVGSATGRYLALGRTHPVPLPGLPAPGLEIAGARAHNLKAIDVAIPAGLLTAVTGVSGSGKSSLVFDVLHASAEAGRPVDCAAIRGLNRFSRVISVGSELPAESVSSNPLTAAGLFDTVRGIFAATPAARERGFKKAHFSFLTPEGRCVACGGTGRRVVSLDFLADVSTPCESCRGARYNPGVLEVRWSGRTIAEILGLTVRESLEPFADQPKLAGPLALLDEIGLGYLQLGQPLDTLSGGELQRLKLASELTEAPPMKIRGIDPLLEPERTRGDHEDSQGRRLFPERGIRYSSTNKHPTDFAKGMKPAGGSTLYLFDEPTAGLHPVDIDRLLRLFGRLLSAGKTIVAVEHNLELIARAGHVIDLGPEGGDRGGTLVVQGAPAAVVACLSSFTGAALRPYFS
jgi:excinuclease ABC subunit A